MFDILKKETIELFSKIKVGHTFWYDWFTVENLLLNSFFKCTKSSKLQWLQYQINQHILAANNIIYKTGRKVDNLCNLCNNSKETVIHILCDCQKVQERLDNFSVLYKRKEYWISKQSCTVILGGLSPSSREMKTKFLCVKSFLYR